MLPFLLPIILASTFILPDGDSCATNLNGYYQDEQIYLCPQLSRQEKRFTYVHEYGHYIWFRLTEKQQEDWGKMEDLENLGSYVSDYAGFSQLEDFAETFAYVLLKKKMNDNTLLQKKIRFIEKILKK